MVSSAHFTDDELACSCCGTNACTPELLDALEDFRELAAVPVIVTSGYRCAAHNTKVGGAPDSEHVQGIAADIKIDDTPAADLYNLALVVPAFAQGGIGIDTHAGYIHVDVRGDGPARWGYDADGNWESRADLQQNPYGAYPGTSGASTR